VRIVSLLPSATEIVYALGLGDDVVGVTHECDWPPGASTKRVVSTSTLAVSSTPAEVDRRVSESLAGGEPIYRLDAEAVRDLAPDLVLTQDLCAVCAVPSGHVHEALDLLGSPATVVSLDPGSLDDVLACVLEVGAATGTDAAAAELVAGLRRRIETVRAAVAGRDRPRVLALEWGDPPFNAGHWVPEMITVAGGEPLLAEPGRPSVRLRWAAVKEAVPDVVVFMPCGYGLEAAVAEGRVLMQRAELVGVPFFAADSSSFFSRPGPRLVDGLELLAEALHPRCLGRDMGPGVERLSPAPA